MSHDRLRCRTKDDPPEARPPVRRNYDQINVTFLSHANNFRGRLAMDDQLFNIEPRTLVTFGTIGSITLMQMIEARNVRASEAA
jgi:hypothetical protein